MSSFVRRAVAVTSVTTLGIGVLVLAPAAPAASLRVCQGKRTGALRVLTTTRAKCRRSEIRLTLNTDGVPGRDGSNGSNGKDGKDGAPGQPQKALTFNVVADVSFAQLPPPATIVPLATVGDLSLRLSCSYNVNRIAEIQATGPAGSVAQTGAVYTNSTGRFPTADGPQYGVFRTDITTNTTIAEAFSSLAADPAALGHVSGTIVTPTQVVLLDAALTAGTSHDCSARGAITAIPR